MMKASAIFNYQDFDGKLAGWSETWYRDGTIEQARVSMRAYAAARVGIMPSTTTIIGYRIQEVGGRGLFIKDLSRGAINNLANLGQDLPQVAIFAQVQANGRPNVKRFFFRGLPDNYVLGGVLNNVGAGDGSPQAIVNAVAAASLQFRCIDLTKPVVDIASIEENGTFHLLQPMAFNVGDKLQLLRVRNNVGKPVRGIFTVKTKVDNQNGTFWTWPGSIVAQVGRARQYVLAYTPVDPTTFRLLGASTRKVGRPFVSFHGRSTRRR